MKKWLLLCIAIFLYFFSPLPASAHLVGQAPFFKVNGVYSGFYNVPTTSLMDFPLAQDAGPAAYLVNKPISFELDVSKLPVPPEIIKQSTFMWDFGDGEKGNGLTQTHTYKKIGSYILSINVTDGVNPEPQLLESIALNIIPDMKYQLPKAVIVINGQQAENPTQSLFFPLANTLSFDASLSESKAKIVSYTWDFGDGNSVNTKEATHLYTGDLRILFPVLRIKDANGFISDSYVTVKNTAYVTGTIPQPKHTVKKSLFPYRNIFFIIGGSLIGLAVLLFILRVIQTSKRRPTE